MRSAGRRRSGFVCMNSCPDEFITGGPGSGLDLGLNISSESLKHEHVCPEERFALGGRPSRIIARLWRRLISFGIQV
jgi:hypothetical protein